MNDSQERLVTAVQCAWQAGRGYGPFPLKAEIIDGRVNPDLLAKAQAILREVAAQRER